MSSPMQTQKSRQPKGRVGNMTTELSLLYAMANSLLTSISRNRVGARDFGQLALAGLDISR